MWNFWKDKLHRIRHCPLSLRFVPGKNVKAVKHYEGSWWESRPPSPCTALYQMNTPCPMLGNIPEVFNPFVSCFIPDQ